MVVHHRYLLSQEVDFFLVFPELGLAVLDVVLGELTGEGQTYFDFLDTLLDIGDGPGVRDGVVHVGRDVVRGVHEP